ADAPIEELAHASDVTDEQEGVRELECEVGPICAPRGVMHETAVYKPLPDRIECLSERLVDIYVQLWALIQAQRVEIGDGADDRRVQSPDVRGTSGYESIGMRRSLCREDVPDGIARRALDVVEDPPEFRDLRSTGTLGKPCGLVESRERP